MPIKPENKDRYPADWELRRRFVLMRARHKCEWCGVPNYCVGQRIDGVFHAICGSSYFNNLEYTGSYKEAREVADHANQWNDEEPYVVIVLTVAHVYDMRPEAASLLNLAALCQRCHNNHDREFRARNRALHLEQTAGQMRLIE